MHTESFSQRILEVVMQYAEDVQAQPGGDLYLVIGAHCAPPDGSLHMHWDIVCHGSFANEVRHHFDRVQYHLACAECGTTFELTEGTPECPVCGNSSVSIVEAESYHSDVVMAE
jgi:Zn finger protein HypA/HybF involved in hydrogenase expression